MKIHAISLVKNEEDVIEYNLTEATKWADYIYVIDNGSTDKTWTIVNEMSNEQVIPVCTIDGPYRENMRSIPFNKFRHLANKGDWWCHKLDADEFYLQDPRKFLAKVPSFYQVVYSDSIEYVLTNEDIEEFEFKGDFKADRDKIKFYNPLTWSELIFFRHRDQLKWDDGIYPSHLGIPYEKKIRLQHYKYRSPQQVEKRMKLRKMQPKVWPHEMRNYAQDHILRQDYRKEIEPSTIHVEGCRNSYNIWPAYKKYGMRMLQLLKILP